MDSAINPEAQQPTVRLSFEQSDRNPMVTEWAGNGGPIPNPANSESRITQPGAPPSADAGLANYNDLDSGNAVENEAERDG
jgi:hypothetical protein